MGPNLATCKRELIYFIVHNKEPDGALGPGRKGRWNLNGRVGEHAWG